MIHYSIAQLYENIPWLSYYTRYIPGAGSDLKRFRIMSFGRTEARYKNGSRTKDLFYYLVCTFVAIPLRPC